MERLLFADWELLSARPRPAHLVGVELLLDLVHLAGDGRLGLQAVLGGEEPGQDLLQRALVALQLGVAPGKGAARRVLLPLAVRRLEGATAEKHF